MEERGSSKFQTSDELITFFIRNVRLRVDGGAPFSVLIPDLNARLGYDIQLLTNAMKPTPASTVSAQFPTPTTVKFLPRQETTVLHGGDHFASSNAWQSNCWAVPFGFQGPTQLRSSRLRVPHSDGLCPAPDLSSVPSMCSAVSCNCFYLYNFAVLKSLFKVALLRE